MQVSIFQKKTLLQTAECFISIPSSKSQTIRAYLFASLAEGKSTIYHPLRAKDTDLMLHICAKLGAKVFMENNKVMIQGFAHKPKNIPKVIDVQNSGLLLRFITALCALENTPFTITGDHSIKHNRLLSPLLEGLVQLGVGCKCLQKQGFAPAYIKGPIHPGVVQVEGVDSQPISALLVVLSLLKGKSELIVKNPGEILWVDLTLKWLQRLYCNVIKHSPYHFTILGNNRIRSFSYQVAGDFSQSFYPIAAALICKISVTVSLLDFSDHQPDKHFFFLLKKMGACMDYNREKKQIRVLQPSVLKGIEIDLGSCIDAITILAVLGCFAEGVTWIKNASIARRKECDRISCIVSELHKMGAKIEETPDGLIVQKKKIKGARVFSHFDHRMVFALTCAAMGAEGKTVIDHAECIEKTHPNFFQEMKKMGLDVCISS